MPVYISPLQVENSLLQCQRPECHERRNRHRLRGKGVGDTKRLQAFVRQAVANGEIGASILLPFGIKVGPIVPSHCCVLGSPDKPLMLAFIPVKKNNVGNYPDNGHRDIDSFV